MSRKADYFIAGTQKGGTTALFHKMTSNDQFFRHEEKEIHFFDNEDLRWPHPNYEKFHKNFAGARADQIIGDATPIYTYWPNCLKRINRYNPDAKLIISLRHPAYRAVSHWKMETARHAETLPFAEAISAAGRARFKAQGFHRAWSYVERGFYADQIRRVFNFFDPQQVFICTTDQLYADEAGLMNRIFEFLGAKPTYIETDKKVVRPMSNEHVTGYRDEDIRYLTDLYRDDILKTADMTDMDLTAWLDPEYSELGR